MIITSQRNASRGKKWKWRSIRCVKRAVQIPKRNIAAHSCQRGKKGLICRSIHFLHQKDVNSSYDHRKSRPALKAEASHFYEIFLIIIFSFCRAGHKKSRMCGHLLPHASSRQIRTQREVPHYNYFFITKQKRRQLAKNKNALCQDKRAVPANFEAFSIF
jgi:hypothetical protein